MNTYYNIASLEKTENFIRLGEDGVYISSLSKKKFQLKQPLLHFRQQLSHRQTRLVCTYEKYFLSERRDSNSRPFPWQGNILATELLSLVNLHYYFTREDL